MQLTKGVELYHYYMLTYLLKAILLYCFIIILLVKVEPLTLRQVIQENSTSKFYNSSASEGGAIRIYKGTVYFKENSTIEFIKNIAKNFGGAIDSGYGTLKVFLPQRLMVI